jgi:ubiquinone/menaquinone biosynthesis C-methylase UbiE
MASSGLCGQSQRGQPDGRMDARLQKRVQRYGWDKAAAHYERSWQAQLEPAQMALLDMAGLRPGDRVLDVACGTGLVTFRAAKAVAPGGEVFGTDISEEMVAMASELALAQGLPNCSFRRMDAEQLALESDTFDVALCALGLMYAPDPERAVAEMHRVLKPGSRAVSAVWGERRNCGWADIFPIVDARVQSEVCPMFFRTGTGDCLERAYAAAGFSGIRTLRFRTTLDYASAEQACEAAFVGGPVALAHSRFTESMKAEAYADYLATIEDYRTGNGYAVPGEFVVVAGTK